MAEAQHQSAQEPAPQSAQPAQPPARVYGDYRIVDGAVPREGSTGLLYDAVHVRTGAPALVKLLRPELLRNATVRRRFREEGEAAVAIRHPGVVKVLDAGERAAAGDDVEPYLVMEKLEGHNLRERLRAWGAPDIARVFSVGKQLARALAAVHTAGVVHRDVKPENLFLVADDDVDGGERVILLDFGIAKPKERADAFLTQRGAQFGTEPYMAPEQWADASFADARTDLYAVGCVLYELLAGEPPFGIAGNLGEAHARQPPPPLPPSTPRPLARVIARLLEKSPAARYATADALLDALQRAEDDEETSTSIRIARAPTAITSAPPPAPAAWTSRHLALAFAGGAAVVVAVVALALALGVLTITR